MKRGCHQGIETFVVRVGGRRKRIWQTKLLPVRVWVNERAKT